MRKRKIFLFMFFILLVSIDGVNATEYVKCGDVDGIPAGLPEFSRNVINVIKFGVPIILCILGMLDFAKAVMAGDEKASESHLRQDHGSGGKLQERQHLQRRRRGKGGGYVRSDCQRTGRQAGRNSGHVYRCYRADPAH